MKMHPKALLIVGLMGVANTIFGSDLVAYYPFNGNAEDETLNGFDGTVFGATPGTDRFGRVDRAFMFDGVNDYIDLGTSLNVAAWDNYSISLWFLNDDGGFTGNGYGQKIIDQTDLFHDFYLSVMTREGYPDAGQLNFITFEGGPGYLSDPRDFRDNTWHHVVLNKAGGAGELWVDGVLSVSGTLQKVFNGQPLLVGFSFSPDSFQQTYWSGKIDDIRIYNGPLTPAEIGALHTETVDLTPPVITPLFSVAPSASGWFTNDVTLTWVVNDAESPFIVSGCEPVVVAFDTAGLAVTCVAESEGGTSSQTVVIRRDATAPSIMFTGYQPSFPASALIDIGCAPSDATSGIDPASVECGGVQGYGWEHPGTTVITAAATDFAGNQTITSVSITVEPDKDALSDVAEQWKTKLVAAVSGQSKAKVGEAAEALKRAASSTAWTGPTTLKPDQGNEVFKDLHQAVSKLATVQRQDAAKVVPASKTVAELTKKIASQAIAEAKVALPNPPPPVEAKIDSAERRLAAAVRMEETKQKYAQAVQQHRLAWEEAIKAKQAASK